MFYIEKTGAYIDFKKKKLIYLKEQLREESKKEREKKKGKKRERLIFHPLDPSQMATEAMVRPRESRSLEFDPSLLCR